MCVKFVSAAMTVLALAAAPVLVSASDKPLPSTTGNSVQSTTIEKAPTTRFATMKGVKAVPMAAKELVAVKGQHAHFWNPGAPFPTEPHVVNRNNLKNWSDLYGQGPVGPGYHGLCNAASNGHSAIFINPGPSGGCGF